MVNLLKCVPVKVADQGRELSAGVNLSIRQQGHKIEGGTAAKAGAATEKVVLLLLQFDIYQAVLDRHDRVAVPGDYAG